MRERLTSASREAAVRHGRRSLLASETRSLCGTTASLAYPGGYWMAQVLPFHSSASVPVLVCPTATQVLAGGQESAMR
jgi:hypothetical protein